MKVWFKLLIVTLLAVAIFYGSSELTKRLAESEIENSSQLFIMQPCDLAKSVCHASANGIELSASFPEGLSPEKNNRLHLQLLGASLASGEVVIQGKDMFMGINRYPVILSEGGLVADVRFPYCTTESMTWQLLIQLKTKNKQSFHASFEFDMVHF